MTLNYLPYDAEFVASLRAGGGDAYDVPAERVVSDGGGNWCRSCLREIKQDQPMLVCAARPFPALQPYAETGPVYFCADACAPYANDAMPPILQDSPDYLLKAYGADDRIIYGTGQIIRSDDIPAYAQTLLSREDVAYVDVRSARNNCFQNRITFSDDSG